MTDAPTPPDPPALHGAPCVHCGTPCAQGSLLHNHQPFCCRGCVMVYDILHANSLGQFYDIESHPGLQPEDNPEPGLYDFLADPDVKRRLLDFTDGRISRVTLHIPQIHCVACVWLLEHLYKLHDGIGQPEVNFTRKTVMIPFEEDKITLVELAALLRKLGYAPDFKLENLTRRPPDTGHRTAMLQLGVAGFAFGNIMLLAFPGYLGLTDTDALSPVFAAASLLLSLPVLLFSARDYFRSALLGLKQGELTIDVPIALGILALFLQSLADIFTRSGAGYLDSMAGLVFFLLIGKSFQRRTFDALSFDRDYTAYFPIAALRIDPQTGARATVPLDRLALGDTLLIRNGELIPADAILLHTPALIDYSFVTGESRPVQRNPGDLLHAGGRHHGPPIQITVAKAVSQSYLTSLWNHKTFRKENERTFDRMTSRVSRVFTLAVLLIALLAALVHASLHTGHAVRVFASILIVACPCALALSAPFAFGTALRILRKHRLFLKNGFVVEGMSRIRHLAFDKTGTLTRGGLGTPAWHGTPNTPTLPPHLAPAFATLARASTHPLSRALADHLPPGDIPLANLRELPGKGLQAEFNNQTLRIGSLEWLRAELPHTPPATPPPSPAAAQTWLAAGDTLLGAFHFEDAPRTGIAAALADLDSHYDISILTGDRAEGLEALRTWFPNAKDLRANLSPQEKLQAIDTLRRDGAGVMMVGDGLNDAGALRHSDVGIAVTENVQSFSPACDAILDAQSVALLPRFLAFSRKTVHVVHLCFAVSLLYNVLGLSIAATGHLSPLLAAILMPLSSVSVILLSVLGTRLTARNTGL